MFKRLLLPFTRHEFRYFSSKIGFSKPITELSNEQKIQSLLTIDSVVMFLRGTVEQPKCDASRFVGEKIQDCHVRYRTYDIEADGELRKQVEAFSGAKDFPQVWVEGNLVADFEMIKSLVDDGKLDAFLKSEGASFIDRRDIPSDTLPFFSKADADSDDSKPFMFGVFVLLAVYVIGSNWMSYGSARPTPFPKDANAEPE